MSIRLLSLISSLIGEIYLVLWNTISFIKTWQFDQLHKDGRTVLTSRRYTRSLGVVYPKVGVNSNSPFSLHWILKLSRFCKELYWCNLNEYKTFCALAFHLSWLSLRMKYLCGININIPCGKVTKSKSGPGPGCDHVSPV